MSVTTFLLLVLLGIGVGVIGTLVGAGGGFILTPILAILYPHDPPDVLTAISLAVVCCNAVAGSLAYARLRRIDYRSGIRFALATLPGAVAGSLLVHLTPTRAFDALLGAVLLVLAAWLVVRGSRASTVASTSGDPRVLTDRAGTTYRYRARTLPGVVVSVAVGFVSSFLGIGGGVVHVPLMVSALGFPTHIATATSHFVLAGMSFVATVTHVVSGSFAHEGVRRTIALGAGVIAGAQGGAWLSQHFRGRAIQLVLTFALVAVAVRLLLNVA